MTIVSIATAGTAVYGLGDNGVLYVFNQSTKNWERA